MVNHPDDSAKGIRHGELFTNTNSGRLLDLAMSWNGAGALDCGIVIDTVLGTFANEHATIRFQMADQVLALHYSPNLRLCSTLISPFLQRETRKGKRRSEIKCGCEDGTPDARLRRTVYAANTVVA